MTDRRVLATDTSNGLLLIVSGPSGVGKTTLVRAVERQIADSVFSVSVTTRAKTPADVEGVDYHFVDSADFDAMVERGELLEWAEVFGHKYGTPGPWVDEHLARGRCVILDIDVKGAVQVKQRRPHALGIFILPPNEETLLERLRARKREDEDQIQRRFAEAREEMAVARSSGAYDAFIVNDDLERAAAEALGEIGSRRGEGLADAGGADAGGADAGGVGSGGVGSGSAPGARVNDAGRGSEEAGHG